MCEKENGKGEKGERGEGRKKGKRGKKEKREEEIRSYARRAWPLVKGGTGKGGNKLNE